MKLGIFSDIHLYFDPEWDFVPEPDVFYICAGDISESRTVRSSFIEKHKDHTFFIRGNHDYYCEYFYNYPGHTIEVNGCKIAGSTLWTEFKNPMDWLFYTRGLVDFSQINFMSEAAYLEAHRTQKEFLLNSGADVIVSHHAPSFQSIHETYKGDTFNHCFVSNMDEDILNMTKTPKLWVHGHVHNAFDYKIGETRIVCHPKGYPHEEGFENYKPKIVEI